MLDKIEMTPEIARKHILGSIEGDTRTNYDARARVVQVMAAALLPHIECDDALGHQPAGGSGFRRGEWIVLFNGSPRKIFASPCHASDIDAQYLNVREAAARAIAWEMLAAAGWR